jgi:type VI secretion system protein ImpA
MAIAFEELLAPIAGDNPSGKDVAFEQIYEDIKEARRQDDASLAQGEWKAELKVAQWPKARDLCIEVLTHQGKDLQVAAWLTEALGQLYGFAGLSDGFNVIERLLADFWETLYPAAEDGDNDLRIGKIAWINKNLPLQIRFIPLTGEGKYGWVKWQESRDVDNLARQNPDAAAAALDEGKINGETFARAIVNTPAAFYQELLAQVTECKQALDNLIKRVDERFAGDAPSLMDVRAAVDECVKLITRIAGEKGLLSEEQAPAADEGAEVSSEGASPAAARSAGPTGPIASRADALRRLTEVAAYFRNAEPHSPVAYLADRAVRWGNMSLDQWLQEMIKEPLTLAGLRESLGIKTEPPAE